MPRSVRQIEAISELSMNLDSYQERFNEADKEYIKIKNKRDYLKRVIKNYNKRIDAIKQGQFEFRGT